VLDGGTAYITDAGMTGTRDSVLGIKPQIMINRFITQMPVRHELAEGPAILSGAVIYIDEINGKAVGIERVLEHE
jgi:calcineurin-like phosphoesterase